MKIEMELDNLDKIEFLNLIEALTKYYYIQFNEELQIIRK